MPRPDHEKNRAAWNEMVERHLDHPDYRTREFLEGASTLRRIELEAIGEVRGKRLLHLMCQFGLDTLSWARRGAIVTGVDISDRSIALAEELKRRAGLDAEFVRCDVLDLIGVIDDRFDIVFQSYGTHTWLADLPAWANVVHHYLKPGGIFFMVDEHPVNVLFLHDPPIDYFTREPLRSVDAPDYCDTNYRVKSEQVEWQHPLSDILNALIGAGLTIERVEEYPFSYYRRKPDWYHDDDWYWYPPGGPARYPLMMSIKARR